MRRAMIWVVSIVLVAAMFAVASAATGPAPNSGDGVSDGSGFDFTPEPAGIGDPFGPAPSSGDGDSDGSGLEPPNGPA